MKSEFDTAPESEQNTFVKALDEFEPELGSDFTKSKIDFEYNATSINNIEKFMQLLMDLGFDVVMPQGWLLEALSEQIWETIYDHPV